MSDSANPIANKTRWQLERELGAEVISSRAECELDLPGTQIAAEERLTLALRRLTEFVDGDE